MDFLLGNIFSFSTFLYLTGLVMAALIFTQVGIREIRQGHYDGSVYIGLALFFLMAHAVFLFTGKAENTLFSYVTLLNLWSWFVLMLAPALIILYLIFGLVSLIKMKIIDGLIKFFIGGLLVGLLYYLGLEWGEPIKTALIVTSGAVWFFFELRTTNELR